MNALVPIFGRHLPGPARSGQVVSLLEKVCHVLEPSRSQYADVREKYEAVGGYLTSADDPMFRTSVIFLHSSFATGTALRPLKLAELDVDLIWHVPDPWLAMLPATLKKALGDMLVNRPFNCGWLSTPFHWSSFLQWQAKPSGFDGRQSRP